MSDTKGPWTFTATAAGYMFFHNGKPQGGAGILGKFRGRGGNTAARQVKQYAEYCRAECARRNAAGMGPTC